MLRSSGAGGQLVTAELALEMTIDVCLKGLLTPAFCRARIFSHWSSGVLSLQRSLGGPGTLQAPCPSADAVRVSQGPLRPSWTPRGTPGFPGSPWGPRK